MISKDKQYRTRCGWEAVVLEVNEYQVVFAYQSPELGWTTTRANKEGFLNSKSDPVGLDLVEVKPKQTIWFRVFRYENGELNAHVYDSKEKAETSAVIHETLTHVDIFKKEYEV